MIKEVPLFDILCKADNMTLESGDTNWRGQWAEHGQAQAQSSLCWVKPRVNSLEDEWLAPAPQLAAAS